MNKPRIYPSYQNTTADANNSGILVIDFTGNTQNNNIASLRISRFVTGDNTQKWIRNDVNGYLFNPLIAPAGFYAIFYDELNTFKSFNVYKYQYTTDYENGNDGIIKSFFSSGTTTNTNLIINLDIPNVDANCYKVVYNAIINGSPL